MYTQIFLVTSVRGIDFPPQTAANAGLRVFGAKSPFPAFFIAAYGFGVLERCSTSEHTFFIAAATLLPDAFDA